MKNRILGFIKKQWLLVWSIFAVMSMVVMFASAEYSLTTSTMKRVVRSTYEQGQMFASNILVEGDTPYVPKYKPVLADRDKETGTYDVDVYLWNYNLSNLGKQYPKDIDYEIAFTFAHTNGEPLTAAEIGNRTVEVVLVETNSQTDTETNCTLETLSQSTRTYTATAQSLPAGDASQKHYKLKFSGKWWDLENDSDICVKVETTLDTENNYQDLADLGAVVGLKELVDYGDGGWEAYISETRKGKTPSKCDAYNLIVTGSGKATITINWDTRYLDCNKNFCEGSIYTFGKYIDETADVTDPENTVYAYSDARKEVEYTPPANGSNIATLVIHGDTGAVLVPTSTDISGMTHTTFENYSDPESAESLTRLENRNRYDIQLYKKIGSDPADWSFFTAPDGGNLSDSVWISVDVDQ